MYWYNPITRTSERVAAPSTDEEAIEILAGDLDSATFVSEYAEQRRLGMEIEPALTMVGHQVRLRQHEYLPLQQTNHDRPSRSRPRASGYELLLAVRLREEGRDRRSVYIAPTYLLGHSVKEGKKAGVSIPRARKLKEGG